MLSKFKTVLAAAALVVASAGANAVTISTIGNVTENGAGDFWTLATDVNENGSVPVPAGAATVADFAGVTVAELEGLVDPAHAPQSIGDGSVMKGQVRVGAGDTFSFDWGWFSSDSAPFEDFAFVSLIGVSLEKIVSVDTFSLGAGQGTFSKLFDQETVLTFAIGIVDVGDNSVFSSLNVTNLSPVPVPAAALLFGSALLGFAGFSARRKIS